MDYNNLAASQQRLYPAVIDGALELKTAYVLSTRGRAMDGTSIDLLASAFFEATLRCSLGASRTLGRTFLASYVTILLSAFPCETSTAATLNTAPSSTCIALRCGCANRCPKGGRYAWIRRLLHATDPLHVLLLRVKGPSKGNDWRNVCLKKCSKSKLSAILCSVLNWRIVLLRIIDEVSSHCTLVRIRRLYKYPPRTVNRDFCTLHCIISVYCSVCLFVY